MVSLQPTSLSVMYVINDSSQAFAKLSETGAKPNRRSTEESISKQEGVLVKDKTKSSKKNN